MLDSIAYQLGALTESLADLKAINPAWDINKIMSKTGVDVRHVAAEHEDTATLAVAAAEKTLAATTTAGVDGLVFVTQTPNSRIPGPGFYLQDKLQLPCTSFIYDVNQGCAGFIYALALAVGQLSLLTLRRCLIVCAETYNRYIPQTDRVCRPLFTDAAASVLLDASDADRIGPFVFHSDGSGACDLMLQPDAQLFMDGSRVLLFTMNQVPRSVRDLLEKAGLVIDDIDLFVFHQASKVVIDSIVMALNIAEEKVIRHDPAIGNTVSATIPIALKQAFDTGRVQPGMTLLLMGFGVGLSLAGCIYRT